MNSRSLTNGLFAACLVALMLLFSRQILAPDAGAKFFNLAQKFENAGQTELALKHYRLLSETQPNSLFAPRALLKQGDLLAAQGRGKNDEALLRAAIAAYEKLAIDYPNDALANEALLDAGQVSADNLKDNAAARSFYGLILKNNLESSDVAGKATLKLGEISLGEGSKELAQQLLQQVLQKWPKNAEIASEAQFQLGVTYETLFKNRDWATRAYDAVIQNFPQSKWANDARQRLGLMVFSDAKNHRPARRVMIDTLPIPSEGFQSGDALWKILRPLLAARGIDADDLTLRGWSLGPFIAAVDLKNPANVPNPNFDPFENVVANAGLRFTIKGNGKSSEAIQDLQDDLDAAQTPLVYYKAGNAGKWALCVGYDSQRGELFLQESGARYETVPAKSFVKSWQQTGPFGKSFTSLSFWTSAQRARPDTKPNLTPAPLPSPRPNETPIPFLDATPSFVWKLPALGRKEAHTRSISRAVQLMERSAGDTLAPNIAGLTYLTREIRGVARRIREPRIEENRTTGSGGEALPETTPIPEVNSGDEETPGEEIVPDNGGEASVTPTPTGPLLSSATPQPPVSLGEPSDVETQKAARARLLLGFFGQPVKVWVAKRRLAAQFLALAARQTDDESFQVASRAFDDSALALETATELVPVVGDTLTQSDREALREIARLVEVARDKEREATRLMR